MIVLQSLANSPAGCGKLAGDNIPGNQPRITLRPGGALEALWGSLCLLPRRSIAKAGGGKKQTENKVQQTKKLNPGRVALGCRIRCFLRCLLFQVSQKRSKLQNEPNFKIKPIKLRLNRFLKMQPYATLDLSCEPELGSWSFSEAWILGFGCSKLSPHLSPIVGHCRLISAIVAPSPRGIFAPFPLNAANQQKSALAQILC